MKETVRRLMEKGAATIVFGCAGMSGMDAWVHAVASEQRRRVKVIDGARVGVEFLAGLIRSSR
jgi:Asp/Glu/hydantoin racemase